MVMRDPQGALLTTKMEVTVAWRKMRLEGMKKPRKTLKEVEWTGLMNRVYGWVWQQRRKGTQCVSLGSRLIHRCRGVSYGVP